MRFRCERAGIALLVAVLGACGTDAPPTADATPDLGGADGALDGATDGDAATPITLPPGDDGHAEVGAALAAGAVRAGRVTAADQLLSGIKVEGRVGDFKLYNDRVAFVIEAVRASDGAAPFGGELIDAMRLTPRAESLFGEMALAVGTRILSPTSVGVVADGSDGGPAIVRVLGEPASLPLLDAIVGGTLGGNPPVQLAIDYVLAADSDVLELRWRVLNTTAKAVSIPLAFVGFSAGDGLRYFSDEDGFVEKPTRAREHLFLAGVDGTPGYLFYVPGVPLKPLLEFEGLLILGAGSLEVPPAGEVQREHFLALTDATPEAGQRALRALRQEPEPAPVSGTVRDAAGDPVPGARVHVQRPAAGEQPAAYVTMARADDAGAYAVALAPGEYTLQAIFDGYGRGAAATVQHAEQPQSQDLTVGETATLRYAIVDEQGAPLPGKLILQRIPPLAPLPPGFGEAAFPGGASRVVVAAGGAGEVALPPGEYSVTAARGFEYELATATVSLAANATQDASFALIRSVDSRDHLCGDFHLHATWSPDANDRYEEKVAWLAAEGLELAVSSEHDYVGDFAPHIAALGLQKWLRSVVGDEISTSVFGHFNVFPIAANPAQPNNGALPWLGRAPADLFGDVRTAWPDALLQVNHPRSPTILGYFNAVGYDPATGQATKLADWSRDFDLIELFNGKRLPDEDWSADVGTRLADWFSLLDRGLLVTATGNSDSHNALWHDVGYPRNCVRVDSDEPAAVSEAAIVAALKAQRVVISGGPFVSAAIGGARVGETVTAPAGAPLLVAVTVQAPTWMTVDTLRVFVGGVEQHVVTLDASTADPTNPARRFDDSLTITPPTVDSHVVVVATGKIDMSPVSTPDRPFAVTNPIYLDVDGNGRYDAPQTF